MTLLELYQIVNEFVGSPDNLKLIIDALVRQNRAVLSIHNNNTFVKLAKPGEISLPSISETDFALHQLNSTQNSLQKQIDNFMKESLTLQEEAKIAVKCGQKKQALSALRRKKNIEKSIEKLNATLENVSACQLQILEANLNKDVVQTFQVGLQALKSTFASGLSHDKVSSTMDEIQELLEECSDISDVP